MAGNCDQGPQPEFCEGPPACTRSKPEQGMAGYNTQGPHPGTARDHPSPPEAHSIKEWQGRHPGPSARIGERPPATTSNQLQPGMAGNCAQDHQPDRGRATNHTHTQPLTQQGQPLTLTHTEAPRSPHKGPQTRERKRRTPRTHPEHNHPPETGIHTHQHQQQTPMEGNYSRGPRPELARDHPPQLAGDPTQEWRGTAPRSLSQDWRGTTHQQQQQTAAKNGNELHPGPSAGIVDEHPPPSAADSSQEWRGTAARALSQIWRGTIHHHQQRTPARDGG